MNTTIEREALLRALSRVQGVIDKRHAMAVLTNVVLETNAGTLCLIASDIEVSLRQMIPARVDEPGKTAVPARTLFEIVRESTADEVSLSSLENHWLQVSTGKSKFKLMGVSPDEHPGMPAPGGNGSKTVTLEMSAGDLNEMIRKTVFAVSTDDTRSNLAGVYLDGSNPTTARMVATDGHRLAMIDRPVTGGAIGMGVILPRKGLAEIGKLLPEESTAVKLMLTGNEAQVEIGDTLLSMRLVEGSFPDYQRVLPDKTPRRVKTDRDELLRTLRRVSILSSERARGVRFKLSEGVLEVSTSNPDMGEASEELAVGYAGDSMEVGFNARYLLDVLAVLPEGSQVEIGLGDELSPGVLQGDDKSYTYVVMPMRI
ncbi:MAG: DNA polymerase III subunit beta [Myxococcales bacterium]|jgi:DNA polymerase-3 subunit beta|nr:MAG: DNA polymerase III subunit beta [Myxococcales bacterium]